MYNRYRKLPSLDLLVGFEAAARLLSFTRAGAELALTQSAVSRQIAALEEALGVPLFVRRTRALELTAAGRSLQRAAGEALEILARTTQELRRDAAAPRVRITTTFGMAGVWLIPRLADFRARHPGIDVSISVDVRVVDLEAENLDLGLRAYRGEPPAAARLLFGERIAPVIAPALMKKAPISTPADIEQHVLLHFDDQGRAPWLTWPVWLEGAGVPQVRGSGNLRFDHYDQVLQAALHGQGVALGSTALLADALAEGRLLAPLPAESADSRGYYVVLAAGAEQRPEVATFVKWLFEEARRARQTLLPKDAGASRGRQKSTRHTKRN